MQRQRALAGMVAQRLGRGRNGRRIEQSQRRQTARSAPARPTGGKKAQFKRMDSVEHAKFGVGTIIESTVTRDDEEVTVAFPGVGIKKLLVSMAGLKKL